MRWLNFRVRKTTIRVMMIRTIQKVTKVQQVMSSILEGTRQWWEAILEVYSNDRDKDNFLFSFLSINDCYYFGR